MKSLSEYAYILVRLTDIPERKKKSRKTIVKFLAKTGEQKKKQ